jgi:hypothetical protein
MLTGLRGVGAKKWRFFLKKWKIPLVLQSPESVRCSGIVLAGPHVKWAGMTRQLVMVKFLSFLNFLNHGKIMRNSQKFYLMMYYKPVKKCIFLLRICKFFHIFILISKDMKKLTDFQQQYTKIT